MDLKSRFQIQEFKHFKEAHLHNLSLELEKYVAEKARAIPKSMRFFLNKIYLLSAFTLSFIAFVLFIVFTRINAFEDENDHLISYIILGISLLIFAISVLMLLIISPVRARANKILDALLDREEIYHLIFSFFPAYNYQKASKETNSELANYYDHGYPNIGSNAELWKSSPLFHFAYNDHQIEYQTQSWKWTDPNFQNDKNFYYANVGILTYALNPEEIASLGEFKFSLVRRIVLDPDLKVINNNNLKFMKRYHLRSNNAWLAQKLFTNETIEQLLELWKLSISHNYQIQYLNEKIVIKFIPEAPKIMKVAFYYHENSKNEIEVFCKNLVHDFYQLQLLLWIIESICFHFLNEDSDIDDDFFEEKEILNTNS